MLVFVPDHLKIKKMCKYAVSKLPFLIKYVPDKYKTQQMCYKAILRNYGMLILPLIAKRIKRCIIKLLIFIPMH